MAGMDLTNFTTELNVYLVPILGDRTLILQRKNGVWEFPGGGVDFGEHPEKAAMRETEEETGLKARNLVLLGITSAVYKKDGADKHSVYIIYRGEVDSDRFKLGPEHSEGRWISLTELEYIKLGFNAQDIVDFLKASRT